MTKVFQHYFEETLAPQQSLSRASQATYVNALGQVALAAVDAPRFEAGGLRLEPAATQYVASPTQPGDESTWSTYGGSFVSLSGALWSLFTGVRVQSTGGAAHRRRTNTLTLTSGQDYAFSILLADGDVNPSGQYRIAFRDTVSGNEATLSGSIGATPTVLDVDAGTFASLSSTPLADGAHMVKGVFTPNSSAGYFAGCGPNSAVGGASIILYGANVTSAPTPSSFITGASRAGDLLSSITLPAALNEGTLVAGFTLDYGASGVARDLVQLVDASNTGDIVRLNIAANRLFSLVFNDGVRQDSNQFGLVNALQGRQVAATAWGGDRLALAFNGGGLRTNAGKSPPTGLDTLSFDSPQVPLHLDYLALDAAPLGDTDLLTASTQGLFARAQNDLTGPSATLVFEVQLLQLLSNIQFLAPANQALVFRGSGFLAHPAQILRRHIPAGRRAPFLPKP